MSTAGKQRTATVKVGVLTILSIGLLVFSFIWLRGWGVSNGPEQVVRFHDVNGMREGSVVQMMGIRVGSVTKIASVQEDNRYYVNVGFSINKDLHLHIPKGSRLSIEQSGLIGEQFLEITPPQLREVTLTTFKEPARAIVEGIPVKFLYETGYTQVGMVKHVDKTKDNNLVRFRLSYMITLPGAEMPEDPLFELTVDKNGQYYLRILPREPVVAQAPDSKLFYTVEDPMRFKRFMDIQMESAVALKLTNDKINQLLSDETIDSLHGTVKNTEVLTARASEVMENANLLFKSTREDLNTLVGVSKQLMANVSIVSKNVNTLIGDPRLKTEINDTIASLRQSSDAMQRLLSDPALKETIANTRDTSRNASQLMVTLRQTAQDQDLQNRMNHIVTQLDTSLNKLDTVMNNMNQLTDGNKNQEVKGILDDTRATAKNMRDISRKFSGHFTLFKLLF
jgi:phospholipid/cholesterol/gamma-HCH transport system substrate-binding protein